MVRAFPRAEWRKSARSLGKGFGLLAAVMAWLHGSGGSEDQKVSPQTESYVWIDTPLPTFTSDPTFPLAAECGHNQRDPERRL